MTARLKRFASPLLAVGAILAVYGLGWTLVRGRLELVGEVALAAGLVALALYVVAEPERVWSAVSGRAARQGANALVVTAAVVGILILLNILAARHHKRWDLTAGRDFSLSPQSLQVLASLQEPVAVTAYMTPRYFARQEVEDLLKEYTYHSGKVSVELVDIEQKPALARQAGITRDGTVIFQLGDRRQEALGYDEQEFTSALVKVTRAEPKAVYFLTGHRERDPQDSDQPGYSQIAEALKRDNYRVESLNLAVSSTVPTDAAVLVIAAPTVTPTVRELEAISAYVDRGGSLLVVADPASDVSFADLLGRWGVSLRRDVAVDPTSSFFGDAGTPLVARFPYHDVTKDLGGLSTFFPLAGSIASQEPPPQGVQVFPLVRSSADSWGETDRQATPVRLDPGQDAAGPLDLAIAATMELQGPASESDEPQHARLVVFGDADFISNDVLLAVQGNLGNADLFLNAANWLAEEESLISIRAKPFVERTILMTPPQVRLVSYTSLIFLPGLVVVAGVWVWWRRR